MQRRIRALIIKEFLALLKDPRSRRVLIIPPLLQLFVFSYAATFEVEHAATAVLNEDNGTAARDLLARFSASPAFRIARYLTTPEQIAPLINNKDALAVIHFESDFTARLLRHEPARLQFLVDGRDSNTALVLVGYARRIVNSYNADLYAGSPAAPPAHLATRVWYNPNLETRLFIVPAIAGLLTLVVTMMMTALSVAREREAGTFDQLLVTPLTPWEIVVGKAVPAFAIGLAEATLVLVVAALWFRIPFTGSLPGLYFGLVLFLLSTIGVGLMISSVALTQQQALLGTFFFIAPAVILSGFATPIENMPPLIQYLTYLNPLRYFLIIIRAQFLEQPSLAILWPQYWPMAVIGIGNMIAAAGLFRRRLG
jgi:ABC-2 type transport system permease protein